MSDFRINKKVKKHKKTERCSVLLKDLKFNQDNPRKISKDKLEDLKKSITTLGNFKDIIIDENNIIQCGFQRCKAMLDMGIAIPISATRIIGYSKRELKAISIQDNTHVGDWDYDKLDSWGEELKDYDFIDSEFKLNEIKIDDFKENIITKNNICPKCGFQW